jgi:uncharacterized protein (TIGR03435 family)
MKTVNGRIVARAVIVAQFVSILADELEMYVVDGTGLTGHYDFDMQLLPQAREDSSFTAKDNEGATRHLIQMKKVIQFRTDFLR